MPTTPQILRQVGRTFADQLCWRASFTRYTGLYLDFGSPWLSVSEGHTLANARRRRVVLQSSMRIHVWIANWRLVTPGTAAATGSSSVRTMRPVLLALEGQKLRRIEVDAPTGRTRFLFDLGGLLELRRRAREQEDCLWYAARSSKTGDLWRTGLWAAPLFRCWRPGDRHDDGDALGKDLPPGNYGCLTITNAQN